MTSITKVLILAVAGVVLFGLAHIADAAVKSKKAVVYCPKVEFVCKPCSDIDAPPTSTAQSNDTCCALVTTGWVVCSN